MGYCNWETTSEQNRRYHDEEWGVPLHDDRGQFEFLTLEVMQCGLNWDLVIQKRDIFRSCFDNFNYDRIAAYDEKDVERIMNTKGMIRSRRKIEAIIGNARGFQKMQKKYGSFSNWLWSFSGGKTILYHKHGEGWIPVSNYLSEKISKELKKWGFKYLGPITVYSHLQACGIINDHDIHCERYKELTQTYPTVRKRRFKEKNVNYYGDR